MIDILFSLGLILAGFLLLVAMGYGLSFTLLPRQYRRYIPMVAPATGLLAFCLVTITVSGSFSLTVTHSNMIAASLLLGLSAAVAFANRGDPGTGRADWKDLGILVGIMIVVSFWSVLHQGLSLYLGTVNPDYSSSLSFLDALTRFDIPFFGDRSKLPGVNIEPFATEFPDQLQARFGAVTFAHLLRVLSQAEHRATLVATITVCLLCLSPAVYFFSSALLGMDRRTSLLAGALVAISAPISMSLVHALVGQNSAIASIPLGLALGFLALREGSTRLWLFLLLIVNALIFVYVLMAPFILAPIGAFAAYKMVADRGKSLPSLLKSMAVLLVVFVVINAGMFGIMTDFFRDLTALVGGIFQSHIYSEYLTDAVVIYSMGTAAYPLTNSVIYRSLGPFSLYLIGALALLALASYLYSLRLWTRQAPRDSVAFVACCFIVYFAVGINYTFVNPYGYSAFKMVSWLNCFVPPFMAYGIARSWQGLKRRDPVLTSASGGALFSLLLVSYVAVNTLSSIDYGLKSYGRDRQAGLINTYGIGNNPEWKEIAPALARHTPEGSLIAMGFSDYIANGWAATYAYIANRSASFSSHGLFPDDDAFLPDMETNIARDVKGRFLPDTRPYFKDGRGDFYLLPGRANLNVEIVEPTLFGEAVWENDTVRLLKAADVQDFLVTGRGFYRLEFSQPEKLSWWFPDRFRWSAEGGEILHFNPSRPGQPYRLSFIAIVGYGLPQDTRTVEIFHNRKKIDEQVVFSSARIVSAPYYPTPGMNKLTIRIKEKSRPLLSKQFSLWNPNIPIEWRLLNMGFARVRVTPPPPALLELGTEAGFKSILDRSVAFNGFNIDGWLSNRGEFTIARPEGASRLRLRFQIPGIAEYSFPYTIKFIIDGKAYERKFPNAGENFAEFPLDAGAAGELKVEIVPATFRHVAAAEDGREMHHSVHLDGLTFMRSAGP